MLRSRYVEIIRNKAVELGFDACAVAPATELSTDKKYLKDWLDKGYNGNMHYMANHFEKRIAPSVLVEGAKSVIVLLTNYYPGKDIHPLDNSYKIARYAYGKDYHDVIKERLRILYDFIKREIYPSLEGRIFVDSAPVLERALAVKAGLGWIGKNSNLIHPKLGSYVFISELIVNLELPFGEAIRDACGGCRRCIESCPTKAIVSEKVIDAQKCISYQTIENREYISEELTGKFKDWIYGCDVCQEVCPWTWKSRPHDNEEFLPKPELLKFNKVDWQNLTKPDYNKIFKGSAVKRAKYEGLMRNIKFVIKK